MLSSSKDSFKHDKTSGEVQQTSVLNLAHVLGVVVIYSVDFSEDSVGDVDCLVHFAGVIGRRDGDVVFIVNFELFLVDDVLEARAAVVVQTGSVKRAEVD